MRWFIAESKITKCYSPNVMLVRLIPAYSILAQVKKVYRYKYSNNKNKEYVGFIKFHLRRKLNCTAAGLMKIIKLYHCNIHSTDSPFVTTEATCFLINVWTTW